MSEDFFGDLGKSISRYTKKAVDRTSTMVEAAKISAQISGERREVDKLYQKIGETVYRKAAEKSIDLDDDLTAFVEDIHQRKEKMASLTRDLADVKGQKVCQNCGELIPKEVAFCPKCGAPTPVAETEQKETSEQDHADDLKQKESKKAEEEKQKDMEAMDAEFTEIHDETADEEESAESSAPANDPKSTSDSKENTSNAAEAE